MNAPIWKDVYYTSTAESITYSIKVGGSTIFNGKAVKCPGAANLEVNVSLICRNFMNNDLPDFGNVTSATTYTNTNACRTFTFTASDTSSTTSYTFLWDWSYQDWNGGSKSMSSPINGHYCANMLVFSSSVSAGGVVSNSISFPGGNYCGKMALYYQGAAGGWNSFLIEGHAKRTDKLTNHSMSRSVKNTSINFENKIYSMDVEPQYELSTGWLTDAQAANLAENLLQSPSIYAHDLETDEIFPVVITDTNVQYKTYRTNSRKPVNYVIKVKASQTKIRR